VTLGWVLAEPPGLTGSRARRPPSAMVRPARGGTRSAAFAGAV